MSSPITGLGSDRPGSRIEKARGLPSRIPFLLTILAAVVFFAPLLFEGTTFYPFDTLRDSFPWRGILPAEPAHSPLVTDASPVLSQPTFSPAHHQCQTALQHGGLSWWCPS